ncbi:hypothetical protein NCAS_0C02520 [Naumovozyma castellii]|uniref:RecQ mediated genome instability protein 1 OB-fold domain-containing protein n=1 Tax=Naumovozyma castellii TaxID=27288 RepID=G0VCN2_NAUCA|nr:hypothetical protein NCAS_0C02520 [Naumovozyma castellii CBS 4309]CCC69242.1 hypothetical protein NCAS_0C02520 [Naumovozyma castellii CBS 4309]
MASYLSSILSQDITQDIPFPSNLSSLGSREQLVIKAYKDEGWFSNVAMSSMVEQKLCKVDRELLFQVLMVENISKSKLNQVDEIKTKLDPKNQKVDTLRSGKKAPPKYKMVNQVDVDEDNDNTTNATSSRLANNAKTVFKFTLQNKNGDVFFGVNTTVLPWSSCLLGAKIIIKPGTIFNKGVFLLQDSNVIFLGGINKIWNENRDYKTCEYLEAKLERERENTTNSAKNKRKRKVPPN